MGSALQGTLRGPLTTQGPTLWFAGRPLVWSLVFSVAHVRSSITASLLPSLCLASPTIGGPCLTTKKCLPPLSCLLTNSFEAILLLVIFSFFFTTKTFRIRVCGSAGKESACTMENLGSILVLGRSPGEEKGYPLQYSGLENSMDCIVHGVTNSRPELSNLHARVAAQPVNTTVTIAGEQRGDIAAHMFPFSENPLPSRPARNIAFSHF